MKKSTTKRALLLSVLSMFLCFTMLVGTTFAWFTDEVQSGTNQIVAGNLDVEVYADDGKSIKDYEELFDDIKLWEPGVVAYENITVVNKGNLALKYQLSVNFSNENTLNGHGLSEVLQVAVVKGGVKETDREKLVDSIDTWQKLSTWCENGELLKNSDSQEYGIVIWWEPSDKDNQWNVNNGQKTDDGKDALTIDLGIKLVATQLTNEHDSFGNDYDINADYWNAETLHAALAAGENVTLTTDVDLSGYEWAQISSYSGILNGNGYSILNYSGTGAMFAKLDGATVKNLSIENATVNSAGANYVAILTGQTAKTANAAKTVIDNVIVSGTVNAGDDAYYVGGIVGADRAYSSEITNCVNYASVSGGQAVGGIAGYTVRNTVISNCVNYGNISGVYLVGGIVGHLAIDEENDTLYVTINNSSNYAKVTATGTGVTQFVGSNGGIVGNVGRSSGDVPTKMMYAYINNSTVLAGQSVYGTAGNYAGNSATGETLITVVVDGQTSLTIVAEGLYSDGQKAFTVTSAAGLANLNQALVNKEITAKGMVLDILADVDMTGSVWTPVDSHADTKFYISEIDGNGHTISNLTVNGQAMFTRFAGFDDVVVKNLTFDNATVNSSALNTSILTVQTYQNTTLDNVDVKNSTISGNYKVAALIATVFDEGGNAKTLTVKNCDVENCTVISKLDFMACGMVAYVATSSNESVVFENCTISNTTIKALSANYNSVAYIYSVDGNAEGTVDAADGVTVTNCKKIVEATVASGEAISDAINDGATNINLTGTVDLGGGKDSYLNLSGKTVTITGGTIKGVGNDGELNSAVKANSGNIVFDGVTFELTNDDIKTGSWGMIANISGTANVTFKNCTFKGTKCPIYQSGSAAVVTLENCTFESTVGMIQCEVYSGDFSLGQDLIIKNCDFTGMTDVLHIYDYDKNPSSEAIAQYLTDNGNTFTGVCKQTCN